jgi:hypothetical protein
MVATFCWDIYGNGYETGEGHSSLGHSIPNVPQQEPLQCVVDREVKKKLNKIIYDQLQKDFVVGVVADGEVLYALSKLVKDNFEFTEIVNKFNKARRWEIERNQKDMYP